MSTSTNTSNTNIIGTITTYDGQEHPYLRGFQVRVIAILHNGEADPDEDGEIPGYAHLDNDTDITRYGGITASDRVEVAPWFEKEGRFSWVTSDPRAIDLACFSRLRADQ